MEEYMTDVKKLTRLIKGVAKMELALDLYLLTKLAIRGAAKTIGQRIIQSIMASSQKSYEHWLKNNRPGY
jgi:hypothetical protein